MQKIKKLLILIFVLIFTTLLFSCNKITNDDPAKEKGEPSYATETVEDTEEASQETQKAKETAANTQPPSTQTAEETATDTQSQQPTQEPKKTAVPTIKPLPSVMGETKTTTIGNIKYIYQETIDYFGTFDEKSLGSRLLKSTNGVNTVTEESDVSVPKTYTNDWSQYAQTDFAFQSKKASKVTVEFGDFKLIADDENQKLTLISPKGSKELPVTDITFAGGMKIDIVVTFQNYVIVYANRQKAEMVDCDGLGDATKAYKWTINCEGDTKMDKVNIYNGGKAVASKEVKAEPIGNAKLGLDITNKNDLVGICYTMWFNAIFGSGDNDISDYPYNVTNMLKEYQFNFKNGFYKADGTTSNKLGQFHFWAEPAQGYYRSTDKAAHRKNLELLQAAGIDFLVLDYTFADGENWLPGTGAWTTYIEGPMNALLDTIMEMRAEGKKTPYVVMWPNNYKMFDALNKYFISQKKWEDCFVYWNGKPFLMYWFEGGTNKTATEAYNDKFTLRAMYGLQNTVHTGQWSFLEHNNADTISYDANGKPEHMTCCVAAQRTYMSLDTAQGREGGNFWYKQWKNVFNVHPKIVTVTWWNEWAAQLYNMSGGYIFTDNFNQEYSRDIEPMKGGHGDKYYQWLIQYVKAYKDHKSCPKLTDY